MKFSGFLARKLPRLFRRECTGNFDPGTLLGRNCYSFENLLHFKGIIEIGMINLPAFESRKKISQRSDESVLISDDVSRRPELAYIRMLCRRHQQVVRTLDHRLLSSIEELQTVQVFEVETQHAFGAVNFKRIAITTSDGITRSLKAADAAVAKSGEE